MLKKHIEQMNNEKLNSSNLSVSSDQLHFAIGLRPDAARSDELRQVVVGVGEQRERRKRLPGRMVDLNQQLVYSFVT